MKQPDLTRLLEFQRLLIAVSNVNRVPLRHDTNLNYVQENDSEHSYSLAMMAWYLSSYFPELDQNEIIRLALAHDILEVHAGDTYIYGALEEIASKQNREANALAQLEIDWPDFPAMTESMHRYNSRQSAEAKFVYALDKIMPILLIYVSDGQSWSEKNVTASQLDANKRTKVSLSPEIMPYYEKLYQLLLESPEIIKP